MYTKVSAGRFFSLAITQYGELRSWGSSTYGEHLIPSGGTFVQVSAGYDHGLALRANGTVAAWGGVGSDMCDTCGQGTVPVDEEYLGQDIQYTAVSAGECFNLVLRSNGTIWAWGWNDRGQTTPIPDNNPNATGFVPYIAIKAGGHHGVALKADGTVRAWGGTGQVGAPYPPGNQGQVPPEAIGQPFLGIGAGHTVSYLIKPDRSLLQWGGACGNVAPPSGVKWAVVDGGYNHSYGISVAGKVHAWVNPSCNTYLQGDVPTWLQEATVSLISSGHSNFHTIVIVP